MIVRIVLGPKIVNARIKMRPSLRPPLLLLLMPLVFLLSEGGLALHETAWMQRLHRQPELLLGTMPTTAVRGGNLARLHIPA
ncbi:hypothetical protein B566_EDAN001197, partial [Ephemera danica]